MDICRNGVKSFVTRTQNVFINFWICIRLKPFARALPIRWLFWRGQIDRIGAIENKNQSGSEEGFCVAIKVFCPPPEGNIVWSCYLLVASSKGYKCGIVRLSLHVPQLVQCPELLTCIELDDTSVRVFRPSGNLFGVCSVLCWLLAIASRPW